MNMKIPRQTSVRLQAGFSMVELMLVCVILAVVMASVVRGVDTTIERSQAEQSKVDLTQEGREFVDEFERDLHQAGYPNCRTVAAPGLGATPNCPADNTNPTEEKSASVAVGLVYVSNDKIVLAGPIDRSGSVYSVHFRLVVLSSIFPTTGTPP